MNPDFEWYSNESKLKGVTTRRCPYASPCKCNKYYSSINRLGELNITTKIPVEKQADLDEYWKKSGLIPLMEEYEPAVFTHKHNKLVASVHNFCPEVSYNVYGLFATHMCKYVDEIDRDNVASCLSREGDDEKWRRNWMSVTPLHFTKCDNYSQLPYIKESKSSNEDLVEMKPAIWGVSINLKVLFRKLSVATSNKLLQRIKKSFTFFTRRAKR